MQFYYLLHLKQKTNIMSVKITIPSPCHEDWNAMTPKDKGRHCDSCAKTVVDFTTWQPQAILLHFKINKNVCGRFTEDQLNEPIPTQEDFVRQIAYFKISTLKKVAAIFLFAFMVGASSCNEKLTGQIVIDPPKIENSITTNKSGEVAIIEGPNNIIAGGISIVKVSDTPKISKGRMAIQKTPKLIKPIYNRTVTMGEPAMVDTTINVKPTCIPKENENMVVGKIKMTNFDSSKHK
jgi:hypothetical protein